MSTSSVYLAPEAGYETIAFGSLTVCMLHASIYAATLLSENFDELNPALGQTSLGAFSTSGGANVDIVNDLCAGPESGNCVDLSGTGGNSQGILQSNDLLTLVPDTNYFLSFDVIGSQRDVPASTTVMFGPYSQTFDLASTDVSTGIVSNVLITVSSPTMTRLTFTSNTPGNIGALLDNVLITSNAATSAVPEPSSLVLLGSGLLLGFVARLRRFAR